MKKNALTMLLQELAVLSAMLTLGMSGAADDLKTAPSPAPAGVSEVRAAFAASEQLRDIRKGVSGAEKAYLKAVAVRQEGNPTDQSEQLWKAYTHTNDATIPIMIGLARKDPTSATAFDMLEWIVVNRRIHARSLMPYGFQAVELLRDHHAANPKIERLCSAIGKNWDPTHRPTLDFLAAAMEKNPDRLARGQAAFALARLEKNRAGYGKGDDAKKASQEAVRLLELVVKHYADCPDTNQLGDEKRLLGDVAERELYELRHLSIGCVAPDLTGEDLDGRKLKLSDYRGKTVVVTFWATWCGPCMQMVPHERTLVERMKGKPFVLLGVNGDDERTKLKPVLEKERITWRSFWNGGPEGPLSTSWNVQAWPTVYVIDAAGVIRFKDVAGKSLDEAVDQSMKEVGGKEKARATP